jgi:hypothetical protein
MFDKILAYQKQTYFEPLHKLDRKQKSDLLHEDSCEY